MLQDVSEEMEKRHRPDDLHVEGESSIKGDENGVDNGLACGEMNSQSESCQNEAYGSVLPDHTTTEMAMLSVAETVAGKENKGQEGGQDMTLARGQERDKDKDKDNDKGHMDGDGDGDGDGDYDSGTEKESDSGTLVDDGNTHSSTHTLLPLLLIPPFKPPPSPPPHTHRHS